MCSRSPLADVCVNQTGRVPCSRTMSDCSDTYLSVIPQFDLNALEDPSAPSLIRKEEDSVTVVTDSAVMCSKLNCCSWRKLTRAD